MEVVDLQNKNNEIATFTSAQDRKVYEQNPFLVRIYFRLLSFRSLSTDSLSFTLTI